MSEQHVAKNLPHLLDLAREVEERVEGVDISIVDGIVMMSPVSPAHFRSQREADEQLCGQVGDEHSVVGEVEFFHPSWDRRRSPDLVVWDGDEDEPSPYDASLVSLAIEVVSPSSVENDYITKPRAYASAGIPVYTVLDPYTRAWTLMTSPGPDGYRERATGPYGKVLELPVGSAVYQLDTGRLPAAKTWQLREAWPTHRTDPSADI